MNRESERNNELRELYREPDITGKIKSRRLRWTGHILRRERDIMRDIWEGRPKGSRPVGCPRLKWSDQTFGGEEQLTSNCRQ